MNNKIDLFLPDNYPYTEFSNITYKIINQISNDSIFSIFIKQELTKINNLINLDTCILQDFILQLVVYYLVKYFNYIEKYDLEILDETTKENINTDINLIMNEIYYALINRFYSCFYSVLKNKIKKQFIINLDYSNDFKNIKTNIFSTLINNSENKFNSDYNIEELNKFNIYKNGIQKIFICNLHLFLQNNDYSHCLQYNFDIENTINYLKK